jgi:integrase
MARPRSDGLPSLPTSKRLLTRQLIKALTSTTRTLTWDTKLHGFVIATYPSGRKIFKCIYPFAGRTRWYTIGKADQIDLDDARKLAANILLKVATDIDPAAERAAQRSHGTFEELYAQYLEYAKKKNKSWHQAEKLVRRNLLPRWGKLKASSITRSDVKAAVAAIESESVQNQTLAAASAIFSWAIKEEVAGVTANPCSKVERNDEVSRERILSDSEIPLFWNEFDSAGLVAGTALKVLLLLGQRPGEVTHMRREHIKDGWWTMPGDPDEKLGWPGTKNARTHAVFLPDAVRELIEEIDLDPEASGFVFASARGRPINLTVPISRICTKLKVVEKVTPHDLRRTHGTTICKLGFGKDAMNRIENHAEGGISTVYDRHDYAPENKKIMEAVALHILALVSGTTDKNVIVANFRR